MSGNELLPDPAEMAWSVIFEPEKLFRLWKEEGNLDAALYLAIKYHLGDEGNGIFRDPDKAKEIYEEIGECYEEYENEEKEPLKEARLLINGKSEEIERLKRLLIHMKEKCGDPEDKGISFKVSYLMEELVRSPYYDGEITGIEEINKEKIKIMIRMEKPEALLFAMREVFTELKIRKLPENNSFIF